MSGHGHHDDFGGLQRDLLATGAAIDRWQMLRMAARFGASVGAIQLLGCETSSAANTPSKRGSRLGWKVENVAKRSRIVKASPRLLARKNSQQKVTAWKVSSTETTWPSRGCSIASSWRVPWLRR